MIQPTGEEPNSSTNDDQQDESDHVQGSLDRFHRTLGRVEGHKRRLIDAAGWWIIRAVLAVAFVVLMVFGRNYEALVCAGLFAFTFLAGT